MSSSLAFVVVFAGCLLLLLLCCCGCSLSAVTAELRAEPGKFLFSAAGRGAQHSRAISMFAYQGTGCRLCVAELRVFCFVLRIS